MQRIKCQNLDRCCCFPVPESALFVTNLSTLVKLLNSCCDSNQVSMCHLAGTITYLRALLTVSSRPYYHLEKANAFKHLVKFTDGTQISKLIRLQITYDKNREYISKSQHISDFMWLVT